jgi:hypothetical protein
MIRQFLPILQMLLFVAVAWTQEPPRAVNPPAEPRSAEEKRLQELLKLKFNRTAPAILDALAVQFDKSGARATNEAEQFRQRVISGDWPEVGKLLSKLPKDHGKQVYRYLLRELPSIPRAASEGPVPGQPVMPQQPGPANTATPTLVPEDVLALAEAAPHDLEDEDVGLLGQLLARLLSRGDALEPILPKLERGVRQLGGSKPADRRRAAELLAAANRVIEAGRFLPPIKDAREKQDWAALDLHARQLLSLGKREKDAKVLAQAWDVNQIVLSSPDAAFSNREPALRRSLELMPLIARGVGTNWLRRSFQDTPSQGLIILSAVSQTVQRGLTERAIDQRQKNLELQKQVVETFLDAADPAQPHWRSALNLLAQGWMQEAAYARQRFQPRRTFGPQFDPYGNPIFYDPRQYDPRQAMNADPNQIGAIPVEQMASSAPGDGWLQQLDESLRLAVRSLITDLCLKAEQTEKALPHIEALAPRQPRAAADLANEFLRVWGRTRNPVQQPGSMRYGPYGPMYYGPGSPYGMRAPGIPLTRAMQARNVRELSGLLRRLESMNLPALDGESVVGAFASAHSPAEVFRTGDIETVFGSLDRVKLDTLAGLAQTMRERLASQWRQPRLQQQINTHRTDKQIEEELLRGYHVILKLIERGLKREPDHWQLNLARAAALFDLAEFQYGKRVDLAIYVDQREKAFKGFERAAALYAAILPQLEEKDQTPKVYQQWFNANLGASDLAYVTRQQEPETNHLQRIRNAILALPAVAAERHMSAFAKGLGQNANSLRPELKPRYLRAGIHVVGDHPDAEDVRKLVTYYDDLLQEVEFVVRVDGDAIVGHRRPFGVFVALRHTADVEREAGGFGRYLRSQKNSPYMANPYAQQQRNFIEEFDKQAREKLMDRFEIKSITFLDEKVQARGYGRPGWRETPLAYLLLQAKDASADQLPALRMDLDFIDVRGPVVLPVASQITLIDARPDRIAERPAASLEVTQILDDREIAAGRLTLEIKALGKGLVPELPALLRTDFTGLRVEEVNDHGLAISKIDAEGDSVMPVSERTWLYKLRLEERTSAPATFRFLESAQAGTKMIYKRYADADIVEVQPRLALAGLSLHPRPLWHWLVLATLILALAGSPIWWLRRRRPAAATGTSRYEVIEPATPFTVIGLLRRMHADASLPWTEADRRELAQTIQGLESRFFGRERADAEPDLAGISQHWVALTRNGRRTT